MQWHKMLNSRILPFTRRFGNKLPVFFASTAFATKFQHFGVAHCYSTVSDDSDGDFKKRVTAADVKKDEPDYSKVFAQLDKVIAENPVVLIMKGDPENPQCGFSSRVVEALDDLGLSEYVSINALSNELLREAVKKYSDWPTIPQLYVNGEFVGGCDIILQMKKSGELLTALKAANAHFF